MFFFVSVVARAARRPGIVIWNMDDEETSAAASKFSCGALRHMQILVAE
jgi:hypothetical protein